VSSELKGAHGEYRRRNKGEKTSLSHFTFTQLSALLLGGNSWLEWNEIEDAPCRRVFTDCTYSIKVSSPTIILYVAKKVEISSASFSSEILLRHHLISK